VAAICEAQHGVVGARQLLELGLSRQGIVRRIEARRLFVVYHRVYSLSPVLTDDGMRAAAVIAGGPGTMLSDWSAAELCEFATRPTDDHHITVPFRRMPQISGLVVHRTRAVLEVNRVRGLPLTTPARAILDIAKTTTGRPLEKLVGEAMYRKRLTRTSFNALFEAHPGHPGLRSLRAIDPQKARKRRTESPLEDRLLAAILKAGLPEPEQQVTIHGATGERYRLDFAYRDQRLAIEADGRDAHEREEAFESDRARDNDLAAAGRWLTLRFTSTQISGAPAVIAACLGHG
jgi:very-short-patch-repair endonuclease